MGRHARHGPPNPDWAAAASEPDWRDDPRRRDEPGRGYYEPDRHRDYPGYPEPGTGRSYQPAPPTSRPGPQSPRDYQAGSRPRPPRDREPYPDPGGHVYLTPREPGPEPDPGYPQTGQFYADPRAGYAEPGAGYADPGAGYAEPGAGYAEPGQGDPAAGRGPDPGHRHREPRSDPRQYPDPPAARDYAGPGYPPGPPDRRAYPETGPEAEPGDDRRYERPQAQDGYWSMSDPADYSDARRPAGSGAGDDLAGQPAFMRPADPPPLYVEPPGQPYTEQTRILPALWEGSLADDSVAADAARAAVKAGPATGSFSIAKSSSVMAIGTLASRLTGFVRTLVQVYALGLAALSVLYNNANTLPNVVYNLALGGILTSVIVPLIVNARRREADGGEAYNQRMFTLITAALLGITLVATLLAGPLVYIYKGDISGANLHLMVIFAYFFIPQIFFYGMSSLVGAVLNSRGSFGPPMWTPVVNNVVVIVVLMLYLVTAGTHQAASNTPQVGGGDVLLLGLGTTLGIAAQTAALVPYLRKVGFRWRPRFDFRRAEAAEIGRMGGWMFCYIAATQVAFLVTTVVSNTADPSYGYTAYTLAWQLFQLPYAVVGISVITALLPRMSAHASEGRFRLVRTDFSSGVRLAAVIVVPCSLVLAALGPDLALVFIAHGAGSASGTARADYVGVVFAVFCLGLLPYMLFQLQLRVFYSLHDSKTPALIGVATTALNIVANVIALNVLPGRDVVAGLGVGFGLANLLGTILAWRILSRRLRGLDARVIGGTLVKMHAAAIPGALFAITIGIMVADAHVRGRTGAAITVIVGGGAAVLLYVLFAKALRVAELSSLIRTVMSRFGR
jgi:putative peptidoglycan lipid II flippase